MQDNPNGFISVTAAIELINSDTRADAKVDTQFLLNNLPYLRVDGNYNIKKLKTIEVPGGKQVVDDGNVFVQIKTEYEKVTLAHAITEHYKAVTNRVIDPDKPIIKRITTEARPSEGGSVCPTINEEVDPERNVLSGGNLKAGLVK